MTKDDRKARQFAARRVRQELATIIPGGCHQQRQSPLFGMLPPELRNLIFLLVLREEPDLARRYHYGGFDAGGFQLSAFVPKLHIHIVKACRLVYYETKDLLLRLYSVNSFYPCVEIHTIQTGTSKCSIQVRSPFRFDKLTKRNQQQLREVHIITPSLDHAGVTKVLSLQQFTPRILNLTIGWRDIRGRYGRYAAPIRTVKFNEQLGELNVRIIDRRSSEEDLMADMGTMRDE